MQHSVYLQGELGERFGSKFVVNTNNYADIFKCINANRPDFLPYVRKCHQEDINFMVETEDGSIDHTDLIVPISKGDVTISLVPAGSKSGIGKILAAIAIVIIIVTNPGLFGAVAEGAAAGTTATNFALGLNTYGAIAASMAINLAMTGIQQLMAPDPAVDQDAPTNYLFSGGANNAVEGDPVPILYGELRVPGRPIAVDILQGGNGSNGGMFDQDIINNTATDSANNTNIVSQRQQA
jgi:predicted phage tail protein